MAIASISILDVPLFRLLDACSAYCHLFLLIQSILSI